jgi:hypothetical protein
MWSVRALVDWIARKGRSVKLTDTTLTVERARALLAALPVERRRTLTGTLLRALAHDAAH